MVDAVGVKKSKVDRLLDDIDGDITILQKQVFELRERLEPLLVHIDPVGVSGVVGTMKDDGKLVLDLRNKKINIQALTFLLTDTLNRLSI